MQKFYFYKHNEASVHRQIFRYFQHQQLDNGSYPFDTNNELGVVTFSDANYLSKILYASADTSNVDIIWLWVMALVHNRKIRVVQNHIRTLACTNIFRQIFQHKRTLYAHNSKGANDRQLQNLMKYYGQNIMNRLG